MDKAINYFGIDRSKDVFDVVNSAGSYWLFENNFKGFRKFLKALDINTIV
jgi:transposase